ncbi:CLUMA_CG020081, isoform A [Clunio marinus]|uniref:CLUMA_CG020081, isoform A n=1 Tax=Clunio marinus TaxID=568069 RepID=A0A1J1J546_9DIPT|nr:CLUMA_CG020081, isoform A [Clunio marinus]
MKLKNKSSSIDTTIFASFSKLTSDDEVNRLKGAEGIINIIKESSEEKQQKHLDYAVKRLIRGNGSSSTYSRTGFYTALAGLLNSSLDNLPSISNIMDIVKKEFNSSEDKGKVDSTVGTALVCGAIIRSPKSLGNASQEEISDLTKCLVSCLSKPSVSSLAYTFINELVINSSSNLVESTIWPEIRKSVSIAKDTITIDPLYLLLVVEEHHENIIDPIFLKKYWHTDSVLNEDNFNIFVNLLWSNKNANAINHPFYVYLMRRIVITKNIKQLWNEVDQFLDTEMKKINGKSNQLFRQVEVVTIHSALSIIRCLKGKSKDLLKLLTPNFLTMLCALGIRSIKDEDIQELYSEFYDLMDNHIQELKNDVKLQVLRKFLSSGSLTLEKNSKKKFITNLINSLEIQELLEIVNELKEVVVSDKNDRERQYAVTILQKIITHNKLVSSDIEWRIKQLKFLLNLAIFKSSDGLQLSLSDEDVSTNATNIKNIFFHCLESNLSKLDDDKSVLLGVAEHVYNILKKKDHNSYLQKPLEEKHVEIWKKMYADVTKKSENNKDKKLKTVFQVLMLHMGFQMFNQSLLAANAITELEAVTKRALQKKNNNENEPEWIEVVIDLFLTLLSQESQVLRNVIGHVFPQLCSQMTTSAFHQILSLLDLNNKDNPLEVNTNEEDSDDEDEDEDENDEEDEDEDDEDEIIENGEENEEDSDIEMDEEEDKDDEPETINDTVRIAVQNALANAGDKDDDDIDLDDMDEAEGEKLDIALANAFKLLRQNRKSKKTKKDKIAEKSLLHFRMRALDLVEIYLKNNPQMEICLETLIFFYDLMPIAIKNEKQSPLLPRFDGVFIQLAQLKSFSLETVANVTSKHLADTLTDMLNKTVKEKTNIQQLNHFARACIFIINCSQILQKLTPGEDEVLRIMLEHLREFFTHRNPTLQLNSFNKILATQWTGNFKMAKFISDEGLKSTVRSLRRTQSMQMLKTFFKNHHLLTQNEKYATKYCEKVCENLKNYVNEVQEVPQPEFLELIQLILTLRNHKQFSVKSELIEAIQCYRKKLLLKPNILSTYKSFCNVVKITFVPNDNIEADANLNVVSKKVEMHNGTNGVGDKKDVSNALKRKKNSSKKEKKMRKQIRFDIASKGYNGNFNFSNIPEVMLE